MRQNGVRSPVRFPYSQGMKKGGKVKKKRTPAQLKASRDESYGKWGSSAKKSGKINK